MNQQLYYQLQAKLQAIEVTTNQLNILFSEANDLFNQIDPNQLVGVATVAPPAQSTMSTGTTFPAPPLSTPAPVPVANPKQRVKLNTPVLVGPMKDMVEDMLTEKAEAAAAAEGIKRIAPYEVIVKDVKHNDLSNDYWASVYDQKHKEEALVPISKGTYDEFNRDPDGLAIDLDCNTLEKTEWFPVKESNDNSAAPVATTTEV